jgi:hypothetical protein
MDEMLFFNGIQAGSGEYLLPPIQMELFIKAISESRVNEAEQKELSDWLRKMRSGPYGIAAGYDPKLLEESGWGVIFHVDCHPAVIAAVRPLLDWRKQQAGKYYREYLGADGYRPGDDKNHWLERAPRKMGPGPAEPDKVPYYLLIIGSPDQIPFQFQVQLDVQYAVGRVCFESVAEYASYARSVVQAEQQQLRLARRAVFFGVANKDDKATRLSRDHLVGPVAQQFDSRHFYDQQAWQIIRAFDSGATKSCLSQIMNGSEPPAIFFGASHGMGFTGSDPHVQECRQGALLCQDWPGPRDWGTKAIPPDHYFSEEDLSEKANLWGSIALLFACYSAGTPQFDEFVGYSNPADVQIAHRPFTARLPQRMLAHPNGGALAVAGHVDRTWGYSFYWDRAGQQTGVFDSALTCLSQGFPIGHALEVFNERYAELATDLNLLLKDARRNPSAHKYELFNLWTALNDAKNFVLVGDPAVRLMV